MTQNTSNKSKVENKLNTTKPATLKSDLKRFEFEGSAVSEGFGE